jgi:FkbM family methyltransferase
VKRILKKIYRLLPFKKEVYSFLKLFWTPPHTVYKHLHFTGVFKVRVADNNSFRIRHYGNDIENEIFWKGLTGGWEKKSMKLWMQLCKEAKVIMDIGANTGIYSLAAKATNPEAAVYAFEPLHRILTKLQHNNNLNHYDIKCIEKALSNTEGDQVIYENYNPHVNAATLDRHTAIAYGRGQLNRETVIKTTTLDRLIESEKLEGVDLVKIDVETHEPEVVAGFKNFLPQYRPAFLVEILMDEVGRKLQETFDPLGYLYFNIDDRNDTIRQVQNLRQSDYFNCLICTREKALQLGLLKQPG